MAIIKVEDTGSQPDVAERLTTELDHMADRIRSRAYELFENRGCEHGGDLNDWLLAEEEILFPAKLDVTQEPGSYCLSLSVPSFKARGFRVYTLGNQWVLQGTTRERVGTDGESATITRSVLYRWPLPADAIPDEITAEGKQNGLKIKVPVSSKSIPVHAELEHDETAEPRLRNNRRVWRSDGSGSVHRRQAIEQVGDLSGDCVRSYVLRRSGVPGKLISGKIWNRKGYQTGSA